MANTLETWILRQRDKVLFTVGEKIVDTNDMVALIDQAVTEVGAEKPGPTRDKYRFVGAGIHRLLARKPERTVRIAYARFFQKL